MFAVGQLFTVMNGQHTTASNTYHLLDSIGVVNHSLHFVDPATSAHTQHAESYWNRVKTKFKQMKGVHECFPPTWTSLCGGIVMEVLLAQLWQVCVGTLLSGIPFRIPRYTICWSTPLTVCVFVFSTVFFLNHQLSRSFAGSGGNDLLNTIWS